MLVHWAKTKYRKNKVYVPCLSKKDGEGEQNYNTLCPLKYGKVKILQNSKKSKLHS
jgi:predicted nucleotide-binding protein (sugar kinase/HSP70/actin superfamily)